MQRKKLSFFWAKKCWTLSSLMEPAINRFNYDNEKKNVDLHCHQDWRRMLTPAHTGHDQVSSPVNWNNFSNFVLGQMFSFFYFVSASIFCHAVHRSKVYRDWDGGGWLGNRHSEKERLQSRVKEIESERERERVCVLLVAVHVGKSGGKRVERLVRMGPFSLSHFLFLSRSLSLSHSHTLALTHTWWTQ